MRQHLAKLIPAMFVGGCSLIYNVSTIAQPVIDAAPDAVADAAIDANVSALTIDSLAPATLFEGQGDGGSRPAILVIHGSNIVTGAQVSVISLGNPVMITVDNANAVVASASDFIAVPVTAHVDSSVHDGDMIALHVQVSQQAPTGMVTQSLDGMLTLHGYEELTSLPATVSASTLKPMYSKVAVPNSTTFTGTANQPVLIRAISSIRFGDNANVTYDITARGGDANAGAGGGGGPGGCAGGPAVGDGNCAGGGHHGSNPSLLNNGGGGGGAGFASNGTPGSGAGAGTGGLPSGEDMISLYTANQPSGGGGGGSGTLSSGGGGGGAGGVVELSAGGNVVVGNIDVSGGAGAVVGSGGGGGAGGVIMVRAGGSLATGTLTSNGGNGAGTGGAGSVGRIRWDAPSGAAPTATPSAFRGPAFVTPLRITSTTLTLIGTPNRKFDVYWTDAAGQHTGAIGVAFDATSMATINPGLMRGYNRVCITLMNGMQGGPESDKCIDVAYLP